MAPGHYAPLLNYRWGPWWLDDIAGLVLVKLINPIGIQYWLTGTSWAKGHCLNRAVLTGCFLTRKIAVVLQDQDKHTGPGTGINTHFSVLATWARLQSSCLS